MITLDSAQLARAWLAVYQASGRSKDQPQLCQTVHLDQYPHGLRLASTDSYMLLTAWIPDAYDTLAAEPGLDEVPFGSATVIDRHGRAVSLLGYLLGLSKDDDHKGIEVNVSLNVPWQPDETDAADLQIDGFEALAVTLEVPDRERLQLEVYEGNYVHWQQILGRQRRTRTEALALAPDVAGRLAKAARFFEHSTLRLWFGGRDKPIQVAFGREPEVTGLVMPCRWNYAADAPYDNPADEQEPEG